jgi:hypothetical protein
MPGRVHPHRRFAPSWRTRSVEIKRDRGAGTFAAGVAFPVMANFTAHDKFGYDWGDHPIAAMGAADGESKGARGGEVCAGAIKLHGVGLFGLSSFPCYDS